MVAVLHFRTFSFSFALLFHTRSVTVQNEKWQKVWVTIEADSVIFNRAHVPSQLHYACYYMVVIQQFKLTSDWSKVILHDLDSGNRLWSVKLPRKVGGNKGNLWSDESLVDLRWPLNPVPMHFAPVSSNTSLIELTSVWPKMTLAWFVTPVIHYTLVRVWRKLVVVSISEQSDHLLTKDDPLWPLTFAMPLALVTGSSQIWKPYSICKADWPLDYLWLSSRSLQVDCKPQGSAPYHPDKLCIYVNKFIYFYSYTLPDIYIHIYWIIVKILPNFNFLGT